MPPKQKRGRGRQARPRGSVYWHAASERWCAQTPPDRRGRRRSRYFAADQEAAAWAWLDTQLAALDDGRDIFASAEHLGDYLMRWHQDAASDTERDWSERTIINYRWVIAKLEELHQLPLEDLHRTDIDRALSRLAKGGLGRNSIRVIRAMLHSALEDLVMDEVIAKNPAQRRRRRQKVQADDIAITEIAWSEEHARTFLRAARTSTRAAMWWLALSCGLRNGELRALQLDDLDLSSGILLVRATATETGRRVTRTKGRRARSILLPTNVTQALRAHLRARNALGGRLFQRDDGQPLSGDDVRNELQTIRLASRVPPIQRVHELRHIAASLMLANGYQIALVSQILGHENIVTTLTIYTHVVPKKPIERPRNIADILPFGDTPSVSATPPAVLPAVPTAAAHETSLALDLTHC